MTTETRAAHSFSITKTQLHHNYLFVVKIKYFRPTKTKYIPVIVFDNGYVTVETQNPLKLILTSQNWFPQTHLFFLVRTILVVSEIYR